MKEMNAEKYVNNFHGDVKYIQIQQGTMNSTQNQCNKELEDYEKILSVVSEIRKYDKEFYQIYKENTDKVNNMLNEIPILIQKRENSSIKKKLQTLRELSMGVSGSLVASGIVQLLSEILK